MALAPDLLCDKPQRTGSMDNSAEGCKAQYVNWRQQRIAPHHVQDTKRTQRRTTNCLALSDDHLYLQCSSPAFLVTLPVVQTSLLKLSTALDPEQELYVRHLYLRAVREKPSSPPAWHSLPRAVLSAQKSNLLTCPSHAQKSKQKMPHMLGHCSRQPGLNHGRYTSGTPHQLKKKRNRRNPAESFMCTQNGAQPGRQRCWITGNALWSSSSSSHKNVFDFHDTEVF